MALAGTFSTLAAEFAVPPLTGAFVAIVPCTSLLPLAIRSLPATSGARTFSRTAACSPQMINDHAQGIKREFMASFHFARPWAGNIEGLYSEITDKIGNQFRCLPGLRFCAIDQLIRFRQLDTVIKRTLRTAFFDLTKINNGRAIAVENILAGPVAVITTLYFLHRILLRDRAILCKPSFRTPATTLEIQFQSGIKRAPVDTGLPP